MLPSFGAPRGGITIFRDPVLTNQNAAFGRIYQDPTDPTKTLVAQAQSDGTWGAGVELAGSQKAGAPAVGANNVKPCIEFQCANNEDHLLEAISQCFCFNNFTERFHPELVARNNELMLVQYARMREKQLLAQIDAQITTANNNLFTYSKKYGAMRDVLAALDIAAMAYREEHRYDTDFPLRVILPEGVQTLVRTSALNANDGDPSVSEAELESFLRDRNLNVTWTLDDEILYNTYKGAATPAFGIASGVDITFRARMFAEGAFARMDGGTLDLGVIRDSGLVGQNKYCTFTESFESLVQLGCDVLGVDITTDGCGAASALAAC
jgi:hypothetical protein